MNKKKRTILIICILIIVVSVFGYFFSYRKLENALNIKFNEVDKILISSGASSKIVEITNKEEIEEYLKIFDGTKVRRDINQIKTEGFCLEARFFIGNDKVGGITFGYNKITINDVRYVSNKNIDGQEIDQIEAKYNLLLNN